MLLPWGTPIHTVEVTTKMEPTVIPYQKTIDSLPPPKASTELAKEIISQQSNGQVPILVVLDDDPTGTQTCHDINVLTVWDHDVLVKEFQSTNSGFFILTNSRALHPEDARTLIETICRAVKESASIAGKDFEIVLRGDSTLRGHFPLEPETAETVVGRVDGWILAPFFRQGGRLTINDIHYIADPEGNLVPAAQTAFAQDATFGYKSSNLRDYVVEKSKGAIPPEQVQSISIKDLRIGGPEAVAEKLLGFSGKRVIIVNAVVDSDMEIFVQGLLQAREAGKRYIYRTGAAFVSTRLGIEQIPPLTASDLNMDLSASSPGGLIIAGSYVPKTTAQLDSLVKGRAAKLETIVLEVDELLKGQNAAEQIVLRAADQAGQLIVDGKDVLIMTSRKIITGTDERSSLNIGTVVANALVLFLRMLNPRPRYIIAKVYQSRNVFIVFNRLLILTSRIGRDHIFGRRYKSSEDENRKDCGTGCLGRAFVEM